jgi:hypothetical protein
MCVGPPPSLRAIQDVMNSIDEDARAIFRIVPAAADRNRVRQ